MGGLSVEVGQVHDEEAIHQDHHTRLLRVREVEFLEHPDPDPEVKIIKEEGEEEIKENGEDDHLVRLIVQVPLLLLIIDEMHVHLLQNILQESKGSVILKGKEIVQKHQTL